MISEYSIQPFAPDKFLLMKELFKSAYGMNIDQEYFRIKYDTRQLGHEVIGFLAIHTATDSPAAFYGVFPVKLWINGKEVLAAQSGDTMTHKDHQKKGLFVHLARITFEDCRKKGIELIFGLPNANSYHGFIQKLNWRHTDDVERFDMKLSVKTFPLPKVLQKAGWRKTYRRFAGFVLKKYMVATPESFSNPIHNDYGKVLRDKAYLNYKFDKDKAFIRIHDVSFWIKFTDVFWIGEINDYEKINHRIIKRLKRLAFLLGYNTIVFHINKSLARPEFLSGFKKYESEPLCFYYISNEYETAKLLLTGADFDTW